MKFSGPWHEMDEVLSTQDLGINAVKEGQGGAFFARNQTMGRGRFGREWHSTPGDSLTMSLVFSDYPDHPRPYLIGMTAAVACAAVLHCELAWPNDLVSGALKLGGILTEMATDDQGRRIAVVGIGINLNQKKLPLEISDFATSMALDRGGSYDARSIADSIVSRFPNLPEPSTWAELSPVWNLFDHTPGKRYRTPSGEEAIALGIGPEGQLMCAVNGETTSVMAADALFGTAGHA